MYTFTFYLFIHRISLWHWPGKVIATVLPPVPTEGLTTEDVDGLMDRVREQMLKVHHETSWDVHQEAERQGVSILPPLQEKDNPYHKGSGEGIWFNQTYVSK